MNYFYDIIWLLSIIAPILIAVIAFTKNKKLFYQIMAIGSAIAAVIVPGLMSFSCCGSPQATMTEKLLAIGAFIFFLATTCLATWLNSKH